jgi:hypothetical protein
MGTSAGPWRKATTRRTRKRIAKIRRRGGRPRRRKRSGMAARAARTKIAAIAR